MKYEKVSPHRLAFLFVIVVVIQTSVLSGMSLTLMFTSAVIQGGLRISTMAAWLMLHVRRSGSWKLVFHLQHARIADGAALRANSLRPGGVTHARTNSCIRFSESGPMVLDTATNSVNPLKCGYQLLSACCSLERIMCPASCWGA